MKSYHLPARIYNRVSQALQSGWQRTLTIIFIAQLMTAVGFASIFPFLPLYVKDLGTQTGFSVEFLAGMVYSSQAITMMIASPIWGTLADRYGRKIMVERAMFGGAAILLLMAFVRSAEELVLLRAVQGLVSGTLAAANALVAGIVPRKNIGYAMGLLQVGLGAGVALGPILGGLIADYYGYAAAFYITALLLFLSGVLVWLGVDEEFVPAPGNNGEPLLFIVQWRAILQASGIFIAYGMRFLSQLARMMIIPIAPLFIETLMPAGARLNTFTGLVIGSAAATATLSAVYLGRLGDRIGHRRILIACAFLAAVLYLPQSLVTSEWQLLALQALVGVAMGGIIPAISALLANYSQTGAEGSVFGLDNSITSGARSIAPLLGSGVALWFGLRSTFVMTGLIFLLAAILAGTFLPKVMKPVIEVGGEGGEIEK
jgi:MFS transporter, DHA1 family, multidrug resistance protein